MIIKIVSTIIYGNTLGLILTNLSATNYTGLFSIHNINTLRFFIMTSGSWLFIYYIQTGLPSS